MTEIVTAQFPDVAVLLGKVDESLYLDPYVVRVSVTDNLSGEPDQADLVLENKEGLFTGFYFPMRGDEFEIAMGWKGGDLPGLWSLGNFIIDEAQAQGPPDQVVIRGLTTNPKHQQRTPRTRAFENCSLASIIQKVAGGVEMGMTGKVPEITFNRVTQNRETDLAFIHRLAKAHGCIMKVKSGTFVIQPLGELLGKDSGLAIGRENVIRYSIRSKTAETQRAAVTRYWDSNAKDQVAFLTPKLLPPLITEKMPAPAPRKAPPRTVLGEGIPPSVNVGKLFGRVENAAQAQARIDASMMYAATGNVEGTVELFGDPRIRAGMTVYLYPDDFGQLGGWYVVKRARHTVDRSSGFTSEIDICHNPQPPSTVHRKTKPGAPPKKLPK